jgi:SAM-dependent methyltransferase
MNSDRLDVWAAGAAYDAYVGRWSHRVAEVFLPWLDAPSGGSWLDVGCGTGVLSAAILAAAEPAEMVGLDSSPQFLAAARARVSDPRAAFCAADVRSLPLPDDRFECVVSGLALNFVPDTARALAECVRVAAPGAVVGAYVWDYAEGMALMRHFWNAAVSLDPGALELDEGRRFPQCRPEPLRRLWAEAGLSGVTVQGIEVDTVFSGFDDYWLPFQGGQGPAPGYVASRTEEGRSALRDLLRSRLPSRPDGSIPLTARAWAVKGSTPRTS